MRYAELMGYIYILRTAPQKENHFLNPTPFPHSISVPKLFTFLLHQHKTKRKARITLAIYVKFKYLRCTLREVE